MAELQASPELVIGEWSASPQLRSNIAAITLMALEQYLPAFDALDVMRHIDTATGVWLEFLGIRVGLRRPVTTDPERDIRFGFDSAGVGFDQAPFRGAASPDPLFPLGDAIYRRFVKARALLDISDGTFQWFKKAGLVIDPGAIITDTRRMALRISTSRREQFELADEIGALPRNTGVDLLYVEQGRFGFDQAGVAFDQGPFAGIEREPLPPGGAYDDAYNEAYD